MWFAPRSHGDVPALKVDVAQSERAALALPESALDHEDEQRAVGGVETVELLNLDVVEHVLRRPSPSRLWHSHAIDGVRENPFVEVGLLEERTESKPARFSASSGVLVEQPLAIRGREVLHFLLGVSYQQVSHRACVVVSRARLQVSASVREPLLVLLGSLAVLPGLVRHVSEVT